MIHYLIVYNIYSVHFIIYKYHIFSLNKIDAGINLIFFTERLYNI